MFIFLKLNIFRYFKRKKRCLPILADFVSKLSTLRNYLKVTIKLDATFFVVALLLNHLLVKAYFSVGNSF